MSRSLLISNCIVILVTGILVLTVFATTRFTLPVGYYQSLVSSHRESLNDLKIFLSKHPQIESIGLRALNSYSRQKEVDRWILYHGEEGLTLSDLCKQFALSVDDYKRCYQLLDKCNCLAIAEDKISGQIVVTPVDKSLSYLQVLPISWRRLSYFTSSIPHPARLAWGVADKFKSEENIPMGYGWFLLPDKWTSGN